MISSPAPLFVTVGIAALWALHAAETHLPGPTYLLLPLVVGSAAVFVLWRLASARYRFVFGHKGGLNVALGCWFAGATLSTILNWQTPEVLVTYTSVFVVGAAIFVGLSGVVLSADELDVAVIGLAAGALVPLVAGLAAFVAEWGTPDLPTALSAYRDVMRMALYEAATFGNRGNTAAFLVLLAPILLLTSIDPRKRGWLRAFCAVTLLLVACNLAILQVRAAFVALTVAVVCVWTFRLGVRRVPWLVAVLASAWFLFAAADPDFGLRLQEQMLPVLTVDTDADASVDQRVQAIEEGWRIFERNWAFGIGPGGALSKHPQDSAHQFQVQEAMEIGVLGLVGSTLFSISVLVALGRTMFRRRDPADEIRFAMLIGPASYVIYAILANVAMGFSSINVWTVLTASMLALAPPFDARAGLVAPGEERRP